MNDAEERFAERLSADLEQVKGAGDIVANGACLLAGGGGALDAAHRFDLGGLEVEAEEDLVPVLRADRRRLLVNRHPRNREAALNVGVLGHSCDPCAALSTPHVAGVYLV